jgi:hypothetical protein
VSITLPTYFDSKTQATRDSKPRSLTRGSVVTKRANIIYLPAFELTSVWRGASEIIGKFNYSLAKSPSFSRITPQEGYCACISWKPTGETIIRYKLWGDVGEILWAPLYNGERVGANFTVEIWNVKPEVAIGGLSIVDDVDGFQLVTDDTGEELVTDDGGTLIGTTETISNIGADLFYTSILTVPVSKCDLSAIDASGIVEVCTDITLDLSLIWNAFNGDYYTVDGSCGETMLVRGTITSLASLRLRCEEDQTWHEVYLFDWMNSIHTFVEQDNAVIGVTPSVVIRDIYNLADGYRVNIVKLPGGDYSLNVEQDTSEPHDYNVIYFLVGALYYGMRVAKQGGQVYIIPSQSGVTL